MNCTTCGNAIAAFDVACPSCGANRISGRAAFAIDGTPSVLPPRATFAKREPKTDGPSGVGGWLSFFCFSRVVIAPLYVIGAYLVAWPGLQRLLSTVPTLRLPLGLEIVADVGLAVYGMVIGLRIFGGDDAGARLARRFLLTQIGVIAVVQVIVFVLLSFGSARIRDAMLPGMVRAIVMTAVFCLIWLAYFTLSRRVRNTYG